MQARNIICHCAVVTLLQVGLMISPAQVENPTANDSGDATNRVALVTTLTAEKVRDLPPITRAYLTAGTNKFSFLIPRGFRLDAASDDKIVMTAKDLGTFIELRRFDALEFTPNSTNRSAASKVYRKLLLQEHAEARIRSEFSRTAADRRGLGYDFDWHLTGSVVQSARAVFIPTDAGIFQFKLVTKPKNFRAATYKLNNLLLSFCASKDGQLDVAHLSSKL